MSRILIDVTRLAGRLLKGRLPTGIDRVGLAYVAHFGARAGAVLRFGARVVALPPEQSQALFACLLGRPPGFRRTLAGVLARAVLMPPAGQALSGAFLFNTGHSALENVGLHRYLRRHGARLVAVVHDLIPITHPEYCRPGELARHTRRMATVLEFASGVVANSRATLDELRVFARAGGQALPPAVAALLASGVEQQPASTRPLAAPYFVVLATIEPRKNHWMLLQLWRRLVERHGHAAPKLVVIGQRGWECENVVDLLERCDLLQGAVIELQRCGDAELATWLRHAQALLFPSFAEGYGMPLVEALNLGTPIIASELPVFREIAGAIPDYLDPLDGPGWLSRIESYAAPDCALRTAQRRRMAGYTPPGWAAHFERVEALMEQLA